MSSLICVFIQIEDKDVEDMVDLYNQNFKELGVRDKITLADVSKVENLNKQVDVWHCIICTYKNPKNLSTCDVWSAWKCFSRRFLGSS